MPRETLNEGKVIVDNDRIWFKSHHGLSIQQVDRDLGLCASAIMEDTPYLLEDARKDPRALTNPLVAGGFGLRFYAAIPLSTNDGHNLGTLCVIDKEPRKINAPQIEDLKDLASIVMDQLELRLSFQDAINRAELMAKEIDHRVMNSLQVVSALLLMQSRSSIVGESTKDLELAANRVASIAQVHRHIYAGNGKDIHGITFLRGLCNDLSYILEREIAVDGHEGAFPAGLFSSHDLRLSMKLERMGSGVREGSNFR